jgi:hypothetical protein
MNEHLIQSLVDCSLPSNARNRCLLVALIVQETFGGQLLVYTSGSSRGPHYVNLIYEHIYDFCEDHLELKDPQVIEDPDFFLRVPAVAADIATFRARWRASLTKPLPVCQTKHVILQDEHDHQGTYAKPDFSCLLLLGSREHRLDAARFAPGQHFWLKFSGGPIVANGKLDRWIVGSRSVWSNDDLRSICATTTLFAHAPTWQRVQDSLASHFLLLFLRDAEVLDVPLMPTEAAYGRTIVPLHTIAREIAWLHNDACELNLPASPLPGKGERTQIPHYRFLWEEELDIEVSRAIDERMPRGGRFWDRVRIVNEALREYFSLIDEVGSEVTSAFREDELIALAEIVDEAGVDGRLSQAVLARYVREAGEALLFSDHNEARGLLDVAAILSGITPTEYARLIDDVKRINLYGQHESRQLKSRSRTNRRASERNY